MRRIMQFTVLAILLSALLFPGAPLVTNQPAMAGGQTWIVDDDGVADFSSIQAAINSADNGDTVSVRSGIYYEQIVINKSIKLLGQGASSTVIEWNGTGAIVSVDADNVAVSGFTIQRGKGKWQVFFSNGVTLNRGTSGSTVSDNTIMYNDYGVHANSSTNNNISRNHVPGNRGGIFLENSSYNTVSENNVTDLGGNAIYLVGSSNNIVSANIMNENIIGIFLFEHSDSNVISTNRMANNSENGVRVISSSNNSISQNIINSGNRVGIILTDSSNNWITSNIIADSRNYAVVLQSSDRNVVSENEITNTTLGGIVGDECSNNIIASNNVTDSEDGVNFSEANNNMIYSNNIANNSWGGIAIVVSSYKNIQNNSNVIFANSLSNNGEYGIILGNTMGNIIFDNSFTGNKYGIYVNNASNNLAYHNSLVNNTNQAYSSLFSNTWDKGYPSGGNYWSDYSGIDANQDGIGDMPYSIDADNQDRYPLTTPFSPSQPTIQTAVTVSAKPNPIGVGQAALINVSVQHPPPSFSDRFDGLALKVTAPNGNATSFNPSTSDTSGSFIIYYFPTQVGTHQLQVSYPGQLFPETNVTYLSASSSATLTVQQEPVPTATPPPTPELSASPTPTPMISSTPNLTETPIVSPEPQADSLGAVIVLVAAVVVLLVIMIAVAQKRIRSRGTKKQILTRTLSFQ